MSQRILPVTMDPEIQIGQVLGNLSITGWGEAQVAVEADPDEVKVEAREDLLSLDCTGDCTLHVPQAARIQAQSVHGDASLKYLEAPVSLQSVFGSLTLLNLGGAGLGSVHGDLSARDVRGDLTADQVYGEAYLRNIQDHCRLNQVHGNLDLREAGGDLVANARGNARLRLSQLPGSRYEIKAAGNIHCYVPEQASLSLKMTSRGQVIRIKLPGGTKTVRESTSELVLGGGEKGMELSAGGSIYLFSQNLEWGEGEYPGEDALPNDFGQKIAQQVQEQIDNQMEAINRQVNEQIARLAEQVSRSNLPPEQVERIMEQARLSSEREMERSQHKLRRAQEKMERKLEAARRRQERAAYSRSPRSWNFNFSTRPFAAAEPPESASEEEQLMILRMLEQKKISPAEADQLLSALEGK